MGGKVVGGKVVGGKVLGGKVVGGKVVGGKVVGGKVVGGKVVGGKVVGGKIVGRAGPGGGEESWPRSTSNTRAKIPMTRAPARARRTTGSRRRWGIATRVASSNTERAPTEITDGPGGGRIGSFSDSPRSSRVTIGSGPV